MRSGAGYKAAAVGPGCTWLALVGPGCVRLWRQTGIFVFNSVLAEWYRYAVTELSLNPVASGLLLARYRFCGRIGAYSETARRP